MRIDKQHEKGKLTARERVHLLLDPGSFEEVGALDRLEAFASLNGPAFYGLPPNEDRVTLRRGDPIEIPAPVEAGDETVTVFDPGRPVHWHVEDA